MNNLARLTNIVGKAMTEGGTEYAQAMTEQTMLYATEHDFKSAQDFFESLSEIATSEGVLEEAYGGGVMGVPFGMFLPGSAKVLSEKQRKNVIKRVMDKYDAGGHAEGVEDTIEGTVDDYLSALANPGERMPSFLDAFVPTDSDASKSIDQNKYASPSNALLSLIKSDPKVINALENHEDSDRLLRIASEKLNQQNPEQRQINIDNVDEMVYALKMFSLKGNIQAKDEPDDLTQTTPEDDIIFDPIWLGQDLTKDEQNQFYQEVPTEVEEEPVITKEQESIEQAAAAAALEERLKDEGFKPTPKSKEERKANEGKVGVISRGKFKDKKVSILAAANKTYKVQELNEAGEPAGPMIYVYPNQISIEGEAQKVKEKKKKKTVSVPFGYLL